MIAIYLQWHLNSFDISDIHSDQSKCPFTAHIRKTRPRADFPVTNTQNHIIRSGIPYVYSSSARVLLFSPNIGTVPKCLLTKKQATKLLWSVDLPLVRIDHTYMATLSNA